MLRRMQAGVGLVEVLVSLVVLSIGLLGLAGLQFESLRASQKAYYQTQAQFHARDLVDRMRANQAGVDANQYASVTADLANPGYDCAGDYPGEGTTDCTSNQAATADIYLWQQAIARDLPTSSGRIACQDSDGADGDACTDGSVHRITVSWQVQRESSDGTDGARTLSLQVDVEP